MLIVLRRWWQRWRVWMCINIIANQLAARDWWPGMIALCLLLSLGRCRNATVCVSLLMFILLGGNRIRPLLRSRRLSLSCWGERRCSRWWRRGGEQRGRNDRRGRTECRGTAGSTWDGIGRDWWWLRYYCSCRSTCGTGRCLMSRLRRQRRQGGRLLGLHVQGRVESEG